MAGQGAQAAPRGGSKGGPGTVVPLDGWAVAVTREPGSLPLDPARVDRHGTQVRHALADRIEDNLTRLLPQVAAILRGAGRVFRSGHRLIRPSQSGAPSYGYSVAFNEITELSPQRYSERPLRNITPEYWKGISGVHTYNFAGNIELIDGRTSMRSKRALSPHR